MKILRTLKNAIVPAGRRPRRIMTGPFKGICMDLDLRTESQIYAGLFERELHPALWRLSRGIRSAVDIGAAHGEYTLFALMKTNAERVISFEPDDKMLSQFHLNLRLNGLEGDKRWELHSKFLADREGPQSIDANDLAAWIRTPCLVKMDIDGGEAAVLRSCVRRVLPTPDTRWIIETHSLDLENECISLLRASGYTTTIIPNASWRSILPEQRFRKHNRWLTAIR